MIRSLTEGQTFTADGWLEFLDADKRSLDQLIACGVLTSQNEKLRLQFVGIFLIGDRAFYCRPVLEASRGDGLLAEVERIDRLLRTYRARSKQRHLRTEDAFAILLDDTDAENRIRHLDILSALFDWTQSYGFHASDTLSRITGSYRRVHWSATVATQIALPTRTGVLYPNAITIDRMLSLTTLGVIQARALIALFQEYQELVAVALPDAAEVIDQAQEIATANPLEHTDITAYLREQFGETNRDHDKDLVRLLLAFYAEDTQKPSDMASIRFYGTSAFSLVWEDICRSAVGDHAAPENFTSNPRYKVCGQEFFSGSQRPDFLWIADQLTCILDAKYYPLFPKTVPNLEDVRKQIFYGLSCLADEHQLAFLLPGAGGPTVKYVGCAEMAWPGEVDMRFRAVHCVALDWPTLVDAYISRRPIAGLGGSIMDVISNEDGANQAM